LRRCSALQELSEGFPDTMKSRPLPTVIAAMLIAVSSAHCADPLEGTYERPKVWPKATPPPDASPIYRDLEEPVPGEKEIEDDAASYYGRMASQFAAALTSGDAQRREAATVFLLPELLQVEPERVVDLHEGLVPGASRDLLRTEIARQWSSQDLRAAGMWMKSLKEAERRLAVYEAVDSLLAYEPGQAMALIREFGLEKDERLRKRLATLAD
jgi:hypothetical protein